MIEFVLSILSGVISSILGIVIENSLFRKQATGSFSQKSDDFQQICQQRSDTISINGDRNQVDLSQNATVFNQNIHIHANGSNGRNDSPALLFMRHLFSVLFLFLVFLVFFDFCYAHHMNYWYPIFILILCCVATVRMIQSGFISDKLVKDRMITNTTLLVLYSTLVTMPNFFYQSTFNSLLEIRKTIKINDYHAMLYLSYILVMALPFILIQKDISYLRRGGKHPFIITNTIIIIFILIFALCLPYLLNLTFNILSI